MARRMLSLLLTMMLLLFVISMGFAENVPAPLTADEITAFAESVKAMALSGEPLQEPEQEEDGYAFVYDFATLYADTPVLNADTAVTAIVMKKETGLEDPRGISVGCDLRTLLQAWPCENLAAPGSRTDALLFLQENESGYSYGRMIRDGQRVSMVEICTCDTKNGKNPGVLYTMEQGYVSAIRVFGLDTAMTPDAAAENLAEMKKLGGEKDYALVPVSEDGSGLEPLRAEELRFAGIDFLSGISGELANVLEDMWMSNDDGTWIHIVDGDGYNAVFTADAERENERMASFTVLGDELEGPRAVRLGDSFTDVFYRFPSGSGAYDAETQREVLYQSDVGEAYAEYLDNGAELRYLVRVSETDQVCLLMRFEAYTLAEITVFTVTEQ